MYATVYARPGNGGRRFEIVPWPPYMPKYGPIEYCFAKLGSELRQRVQPDWTFDDLEYHCLDILTGMMGRNGAFDRLFQHCGY